jgi:hypothetical protein
MNWWIKLAALAIIGCIVFYYQVEVTEFIGGAVRYVFFDLAWLWLLAAVGLFFWLGHTRGK